MLIAVVFTAGFFSGLALAFVLGMLLGGVHS